MKIARILSCLVIIAASALAERTIADRTHVVRQGETLSSIAREQLGAQRLWKGIAVLNGIDSPYMLTPAMVLKMPGAGLDSAGAGLPPAAKSSDPAELPPGSPPAAAPEVPSAPNEREPLQVDDVDRADILPLPRPGAIVIHDVAEAIALARSEHPEFRALRSDEKAARAGLVSARLAGQYNPELEGEVGRREEEATAADPARSHTDFAVGISQEIEIAGQGSARLSTAELEISRRLLSAAWTERQLEASIKEAFILALSARDRLALLREAERVRRRLESATRGRFESGDVAEMELSLAEMEGARARSARTRGEAELQARLSKLAEAVGLSHDSFLAIDAFLIEPPSVPDRLMDRALARADLRAAQWEEKYLLARARQALAEGAPNITLGGGYRREESTTDIYYARIGIPLPLVNKNKGEAARLTHEADASAARAEALRRSVLLDVERESAALALARTRLAQLRPALARANENLILLEEARQEGLVSMAEYLFMQSASLEAREEFIDALQEGNLAVIQLERAAGIDLYTGTATDRTVTDRKEIMR